MKPIYLISILCQFIPSAECQIHSAVKHTANIEIRNVANNEPLWTDQLNTIFIDRIVSNDSLLITSSQGRVYQREYNWFSIDSLNAGTVMITAYKIVKERKRYLSQKKFKVKTPKDALKYKSLVVIPEISLGGLKPGKVKLDSLKRVTSLAISKDFKIVKAELLIGHQTIMVLTSNEFDDQLKSIWKHLINGTCVIIHGIQFSDKKGEVFKYPTALSYCAE